MAFNRKQKLRDNIEAVRTAFTLDRERRTPTERERALLERYCGFGGLKCILNPARELADAVHWAKSDLELFAPTVELHRIIRENSRDETEYKRYVDSLKASVLTAFYTPQAITDTIVDVLHDKKVRPKLVLEPSAGMGAFIAPVLSDNPQAEVMAFEKDLLTGKMLGHLYPQQKIRTEGFEEIEKPFLNRFDLAISNIPFGDIAVFDPEYTNGSVFKKIAARKVHTYFFLKGLDAVRDGGIVAFITSQGVLDTEGNGGTRYMMMRKADLVSAIRLPNNLFTEDANTEVGCDLIILQKNEGKEELSEEDKRLGDVVKNNHTGISTNGYFFDHPEYIIHTEAKRDTDPYGKPAMVYTHSGGVEGIATDLYRILSADLSARLDLERYNGVKAEKRETQTIFVQPQVQEVQQPKVEIEEKTVQPNAEAVKSAPQVVETKQHEAPVMDLYDLFGYTQEERRLAERGLKPDRKKGTKSKRRKPVQPSLFPMPADWQGVTAKKENEAARGRSAETAPAISPEEVREIEEIIRQGASGMPESRHEEPVPMHGKTEGATAPAEDDDPEDAVYRSLDWETNPPINGFYEMMMSLTPEKRAELRRMGKEKMDANAAKQADTVRPQSIHPVYPVENGFEAEGRRRIERVEREVREEEAALTPEERQRRKEEAMMPRPFKGIMEPHLKEGSMVWEHTGGVRFQIGVLKDVTKYGATFQPLDMEGMQAQKAQLYIDLRNTYERLYAHEAENHEENALLRRNLNTYYDEFVMRYGNLNAKHNAKLILMDASGRNMLSLERGENGKFVKADIFDHPVSFSQETLAGVESPEEALSASLNRYGGVNLPYMESLCDLPQADILEALKGRVFYNPLADGYEIADRFIAGNVVQKTADVEDWIKENEGHGMLPQAQESLAALRESIPEQIPFEDLDFNFGERWIPTGVYAAYMSRLFDTEVRITYSENIDEYAVACSHKTMKITDEFLVKGYYRHYDGMNLLKHALHNTCPDMMKSIGKDEHGNDIKVRDSEGIQLANAKIDEIRGGFTEWLEEQSPEFKKRLTDMYNNKFNCFVRPKYDGSHQKFPDLDLKGLGIKDLYPSQKDCVWMLKLNIGGIADQEVLRPYRAYSKCRSGNLPGKGFRCRSLANLSTQPKGGGECRMLETA